MNRLIGVLAIAFAAAGCSHTDNAGTTMTTQGYAFAPPAFYAFCDKQPSLCSTRGKSKVFALTDARLTQLKKINSSVNQRISQRLDAGRRADEWHLPTSEGDCEDFAILKKAELAKRGWPTSALLLTVGTLGGTGHTVLTVRTDKGDLILDNRTDSVKDWSRTPYRFFARQSQSEGRKWTRIGAASPI